MKEIFKKVVFDTTNALPYSINPICSSVTLPDVYNSSKRLASLYGISVSSIKLTTGEGFVLLLGDENSCVAFSKDFASLHQSKINNVVCV